MNSKQRQSQLRVHYGEKARRLPKEVTDALDVLLGQIPESRYQTNLHDAVIKALLQPKVTPTHKAKSGPRTYLPKGGSAWAVYTVILLIVIEMGYRYWPLLLSL